MQEMEQDAVGQSRRRQAQTWPAGLESGGAVGMKDRMDIPAEQGWGKWESNAHPICLLQS